MLQIQLSFCGFSGCEECNVANPSVCLKHGPLHPILNRPVMTKARASLPLVLYIDRFLGGVFSKRRIPKRTQFGPVEGPLVPQAELQDHYIHLKVNRRFIISFLKQIQKHLFLDYFLDSVFIYFYISVI